MTRVTRSLCLFVSVVLLACTGGVDMPDPPSAAPTTSVPPPSPAPAPAPLALVATALPAGVNVTGAVAECWTYTDTLGQHLLVLTEVAEHHPAGQDPDLRDAELYGYEFLQSGGRWTEVWKIQDFVRACPNDLLAQHVRGSADVTDLDGDGYAENAFVYRVACRGDVSPATQKLMMHEGATKYALRGEAKLTLPDGSYGGTCTPDPAFSGAPAAFLEHAMGIWRAHEEERMGG